MTELFFCADGNRKYAEIAIRYGFGYGAQLPNTIYFPPAFVDQDWVHPNRERYINALAEHKPRIASVLDWERSDQLSEVLEWAEAAAPYVSEAVIIIPKVPGGIEQLPRTIGGKSVRLGYSTPVKNGGKFSGTGVPLREFAGWPCHILGGSPQKQYMLAHKGIRAASADGNYIMGQANAGRIYAPEIGRMVNARNKYFPQLKEAGLGWIDSEVPSRAFALSAINVRAMWQGAQCSIRYGIEGDIPNIKKIAQQYKNELGFVNSAALRESIQRFGLFVAIQQSEIVGFMNTRTRRDGVTVVYEIAVRKDKRGQGIGRALMIAAGNNVRLKCTAENIANEFYAAIGMNCVGTEAGRKRALHVWHSS